MQFVRDGTAAGAFPVRNGIGKELFFRRHPEDEKVPVLVGESRQGFHIMEVAYFFFIPAADFDEEFGEFPVLLAVSKQVPEGTALRLYGFRVALEVDQRFQDGGEFLRSERPGTVRHAQRHVVDGQLNELAVQGDVILHVFLLFFADNAVEGEPGQCRDTQRAPIAACGGRRR